MPAAFNTPPPAFDPVDPQLLAQIESQGWGVSDHWQNAPWLQALMQECRTLWQNGHMQAAQVGRGTQQQAQPRIRGDHIFWLEPPGPALGQQAYWASMEQWRQQLNAQFFLGLFDLEAHFACYPAGQHYARHLDQHRDQDTRRITSIVYLNPQWGAEDGGELQLYSADGRQTLACIQPQAGRMVSFLSAKFPHEVLPARRERMSLTAWFRRPAALPGLGTP